MSDQRSLDVEYVPFTKLLSTIVDNRGRSCPTADSGIPLIATNCIRNDRLYPSFEKIRYVSRATYDSWFRGHPQPGDLIFVCKGAPGRVCMTPDHVNFCIAQDMVAVRPDQRQVYPRYLLAALRSPAAQGQIANLHVGTLIPHFKKGDFGKLLLPLPARRDQEVIGDIYFSISAKISVNDRIAAAYENILRREFEAIRIDTEPGPLDSIPVSDLIEFNPRLRPPGTEDAAYLDMAALPTATARVTTWIRRPPKSGTRFMNADTLMARITPCLENGKTAFIDFLNEGEVGVGSTEFIVMRARAPYPSHLSYFLARSPRYRTYAIRNMVGSSGRQRVSAAPLMDLPVRRPDLRELEKFGAAASSAFSHMKSLGAESKVLAELRDTLLPKLMSGEIRTRDAEKIVEKTT